MDVERGPWQLDGVSLTADLVLHPGPTVGFRIETAHSIVAYIPDHEPALAGGADGRPLEWISGGAVARGADLLLHDAQYFQKEYEARIGWGHSSVSDATAFARAARVGKLVLFHHEPTHSDRELERLEDIARELGAPAPTLAREGMVFDL
jgi:ribonuclease BN (tRNA processing enzyme)